jgi:hypothetical protein
MDLAALVSICLISVNNQHYQSRGLKRIDFAISELEEGITLSATSIFFNQIRVIIVCIKKHP